MKFDQAFEDSVLGACLRDTGFLKRAVRIVDAHHFAGKEREWIWKVISETWNKFQERATPRLLAARAKRDFKDEERRKPHLALAIKLWKAAPDAPESALEELKSFVRYVNLQLGMEAAAECLERGELDEAESSLEKAKVRSVDRAYTHVQWIEGFEDRQAQRKYEREHPDEFTVIPTGIKKLDKALSGGARIGEVGLIMGTTGRGKSILSSNFAHSAIKHGFPTVVFGMEMPARQIAARHDSRWSGMEYNKFKQYDFRPDELRELDSRLRRARKQFKNKLHIISMPVRSADIRTIRGALQDLKDEHGFTPAQVVMDSADHLNSTNKSLESFRLQQAEVYWELKRLAEEDGYMVWSTTHAGREWATKIATAEASSESYDKSRIADLVLSINDPAYGGGKRRRRVEFAEELDEEKDDDEEIEAPTLGGSKLLELFLAKYRDGISMMKIPLDADFARILVKEKEEGDAPP